MQKKSLLLVFLLIVAVGIFVYPKVFVVDAAVSLSDVSANPSQFVGDLTIGGIVGTVFPKEGGFVLVDEKGCCQINILVPFTKEQMAALALDETYSGQLPTQGDPIEVKGTLKREGSDYTFDVEDRKSVV